MAKALLAFHGDPKIQAKYIARVQAHHDADEIIHGTYWERGKGCAVGCTIHSSRHADYERELGIPMILAKLEDRIFEDMNNGDAKEFPGAFLRAIPLGADLSGVWDSFALWLMIDPQYGVRRLAKDGTPQALAIERVAELFKRKVAGKLVAKKEWAAASADAYAAASAATYAATYAAAYAAASAATSAAASASRRGFWKAVASKLIALMAAAPVPK